MWLLFFPHAAPSQQHQLPRSIAFIYGSHGLKVSFDILPNHRQAVLDDLLPSKGDLPAKGNASQTICNIKRRRKRYEQNCNLYQIDAHL